MSFQQREAQREQPIKYELFRFTYGKYAYCYTNAEEPIVSQGYTFLPEPGIVRSDINSTSSENKSEVQLTVVKDNSIARFFMKGSPKSTITLDITQVHLGFEEEVNYFWFGEVVDCTFRKDKTALLVGKPLNTILKAKATRMTYQGNCNWDLFFEGCYLFSGDWEFDATVTNISSTGTTVFLDKIIPDGFVENPNASPYLINGYLETNEEYLMVVAVDYSQKSVSFLIPFSNLNIGDVVRLSPGCMHTSIDCFYKFNNFENFKGYEFVPEEDPQERF